MHHNSFHKLPQTKSHLQLTEGSEYPWEGLTLRTPKNPKESQLLNRIKSVKDNPEEKPQFINNQANEIQNSSSRVFLSSKASPAYQSVGLTLKQKVADFQKKIQQNQSLLDKLKRKDLIEKFTIKIKNKLNNTPNTVSQPSPSTEPTNNFHKDYDKMFNDQLQQKKTSNTESLREQKRSSKQIMRLNINQREENFMVIRYLDQGSYGKVYLTVHITTGLILCIKSIHKADLNQDNVARLIQEIKIQSFVSHPNILNLYGYTADAERIYLLLEPCLGSNAYKRLSRAPIPEKEVRRHAKEICSAVEHLHRCDVIHRDIKAENVLFHEGTVKLCDFGWAVYAPMLRSTQCGTPLYTPPEIVKNEPYDSKVDLWCLGVLVYEMLYGTSPFQIRRTSDLVKIIQEQVFFSKESAVSEAAKDFIGRCLEKKPIRRLNIRQALEHEFIVSRLQHYRHTLA